jgi:hypothetical protein
MADAPVAYMEPFAVHEGDPYWGAPDADGSLPGRSLREMREELGGDVGFLTDARGKRHRLSLVAWRDAGPDRTRIIMRSMVEQGWDPQD